MNLNKLSFNNFLQFSLSSLVLLSLSACGDKVDETADALKTGTFNVVRHGCEGELFNPADEQVSLQMQFTEEEMITMKTDSNGLNNENNDYYEDTSNNNFDYGYYGNTESERDLIRYVDQGTIEVVSRETTRVARFSVEFKNDDRNVILRTHAVGDEAGCDSGKAYVIELFRQE